MNVGSLIGQYRIVRQIGAGGMGAVYLGEHILLGRRAAIKTLLPALSANREIVERFFNEARATSAISDAGVVQVFDFGYHVDGTAYIVMELLEGECLSARIDRLGQLPISEGLRIARQTAGSLAAAHERGIVHRDLKPENIFLIRDVEAQGHERTKILDFGICKLGLDKVRITASGTMLGTPVYMSPEQCRGNSDEVDHRSDIYALGCVLFHMLTGRAPFEHDAPGDFIVSHMREQPPTPSELVPALPPMVDDLLLRCLAKSPEDRFQSMGELANAIEHVLGHISAPGTHTSSAPPALILGAGFKSVYYGNLGSVAARPPTPAGHNSGLDSGVIPDLRRGRRVVVGLVLAAALAVAAWITTRVTIGGVEAVAEPSYRYTTPVESLPPIDRAGRAPAVPIAPSDVASDPASNLTSERSTELSATQPEPLEITEPKPAARPAPKTKPAPRRTAPKKKTLPKRTKSAPPPMEDLYDTR
ncbi:MAG: protein kinase [Deltaproteobacteria bacterium]|nr:protein kinase [Deltaproteobacteria bacterium]MDQ3299207.1 protein kinase [Myxococcota bacterium]